MATKKSSSKILIVLLLVAVVLISGCAGKQATPQAAAGGGKIFVGGDKGLVASFLPGAPPKDVYKGDTIDFSVTLENKGEAAVDIGKARVYLGGISLSGFGITGSPGSDGTCVPTISNGHSDNKIECPKETTKRGCEIRDVDKSGKGVPGVGGGECTWHPILVVGKASNQDPLSEVKPIAGQAVPGGREDITFTSPSGYLYDVPGAGLNDLTATATVCYPYKTKAIALACLAPNLLAETVGKEVCKISGEKNPQSSGAPIKVVSAVELPLGREKVGFQIKIKDISNGNSFQKDVDGCQDLRQSDLNRVVVNAWLGNIADASKLECSPSTVLLAENKEGITTCRSTEDQLKSLGLAGVSQQVLTIEASYNYMSQTSQKFNVKPSG